MHHSWAKTKLLSEMEDTSCCHNGKDPSQMPIKHKMYLSWLFALKNIQLVSLKHQFQFEQNVCGIFSKFGNVTVQNSEQQSFMVVCLCCTTHTDKNAPSSAESRHGWVVCCSPRPVGSHCWAVRGSVGRRSRPCTWEGSSLCGNPTHRCSTAGLTSRWWTIPAEQTINPLFTVGACVACGLFCNRGLCTTISSAFFALDTLSTIFWQASPLTSEWESLELLRMFLLISQTHRWLRIILHDKKNVNKTTPAGNTEGKGGMFTEAVPYCNTPWMWHQSANANTVSLVTAVTCDRWNFTSNHKTSGARRQLYTNFL